jgi:hypothetical protein
VWCEELGRSKGKGNWEGWRKLRWLYTHIVRTSHRQYELAIPQFFEIVHCDLLWHTQWSKNNIWKLTPAVAIEKLQDSRASVKALFEKVFAVDLHLACLDTLTHAHTRTIINYTAVTNPRIYTHIKYAIYFIRFNSAGSRLAWSKEPLQVCLYACLARWVTTKLA